MKYGESLFDIFYLLTAVITGFLIVRKSRNKAEAWMGYAVLILGFGDAFHLVPRVLNYFAEGDFTEALGIGKLVTSVTMTVFYVILHHAGSAYYGAEESREKKRILDILLFARIILCLAPQNGWVRNDTDMTWGILRNIPFVILGAIVMLLFYRHRNESRRFRLIWLWILLSFAFYIPVAVFAGVVPILGMLMLPKTICYLFMVFAFYNAVTKDEVRGDVE